MKTRLAIGSALLAVLSIALGWYFLQTRVSVPIIGILHPGTEQTSAASGFVEQMRDYGYEEGSTVTYLYDGPAGANLTDRAQELVTSGATLIYSASTPATKAALNAARGTDTIVIFGPVNDPVGAGFVDNLRTPGRSTTGVTLTPSTAKRLAWFAQFSPSVQRILVPFNPNDKSATTSLARLETHAAALGLVIVAEAVSSPDEVLALFADLPQDIDAVFLPRDSMISAAITKISPATIARNMPLSASSHEGVKKGALFSYGVMLESVGQMAARLTRDVLSGTDPAIIPVEIAESHLFINKKTARAIGLELSPALLSQAKMLLP